MKEYSVTATGITVANHAPLSLVALMPPAGGMIEILRMWISQNANANSAQQGVQWAMVSTPFQTVTSATPQKTKSGDAASAIVGATTIAAGKCGINASNENANVIAQVWYDNFNVLNGWLWVPTPREIIELSGQSSYAFALQFSIAPVTLSNWSFGVTYGEKG
jgi:hypothetical protein